MCEFQQIKDNLNLIAALQNLIFQSDFERLEEIYQIINSNNLFGQKHSLFQLLMTINRASFIRNKCISMAFSVLDFFSQSIRAILKKSEIIKLITNPHLVLYLFKSNVIGINEIITISHHGYSNFLFFSSILQEQAPMFFSKMKSRSSIIRKSLASNTNIETSELLAEAIETDNTDLLQTILSKNNIPIDFHLTFSLTKNNAYKELNQNSPSLIEYAAFQGSINTFKFLLLNNAKFYDEIMLCAIAGGSFDIIHLVESKGIEFNSKCIETAIQFQQNDMVSYIIDNYEIEMNNDIFLLCIEYYNIPLFLDNIELFRSDENLLNNAFILACQKSELDIVKMLSLFLKKLNYRGLTIAAEKGNLEIIQYLIDIRKYDANSKCENNWTPLFYAVKHNKKEIVEYLLSLPNIDANAQDTEIGNSKSFREFKTLIYQTSLHIAAIWKKREIFDTLMKYPAIDPQIKNACDVLFFMYFLT